MSQISASIDEVLELNLVPLLKTRGFSKSARHFHRKAGENWQVVNVQASQGNVGTAGKFTVNLGVYLPAVSDLVGVALTGRPKEYDCTIRKRIGGLLPGLQDYWWEITASTALKAIAQEAAAIVERLGLPWLEAHSSVERAAEALRDQPSIVSAAAALASGDRSEARRRIERMEIERPRAVSTARAWAREQRLDTE